MTQIFNFSNLKIILTSVLAYFILSSFIDKSISPDTMFNHFDPDADSFSYLQVGNWLLGGEYSEHVAYRPFLFPLIVASVYSFGGVYLLWFYQFCVYILGHFFLVKAIEKYTNKNIAVWIGSGMYLINFSLIGLTYHALTEPTVVFGLSLIVYIIVLRLKDQLTVAQFWSWTLFVFGCLTLVKPVFLIPFYFCILLIIFKIIFKKVKLKNLRLWPVIGVISAIVFQLLIMRSTFGETTVSKVSDKTYKNYLLSQVLMQTEKATREEAILQANEMNPNKILAYSIENYRILTSHFFENLQCNIQSHSFIENYSNPGKSAKAALIMSFYNKATLYIHVFILAFGFLFFLNKIRLKSFKSILLLGLCWTLLLYYIFVTGISFDQRDRLVIGALPLWIFFLVVFCTFLFDSIKGKAQN